MSYIQERLAEIAADKPTQIRAMSKSALRYVTREVSRHGKTCYYFRKSKKANRIRLPDPDVVGKDAFNVAYKAAMRGEASGRFRYQKPHIAPDLNKGKIGVVYFMQMGSAVKIGFTTNARTRLASLRTACPEPAEILQVIPGTDQTERYFHQHFAPFRLQGEWFALEGDLATFLARASRPVHRR